MHAQGSPTQPPYSPLSPRGRGVSGGSPILHWSLTTEAAQPGGQSLAHPQHSWGLSRTGARVEVPQFPAQQRQLGPPSGGQRGKPPGSVEPQRDGRRARYPKLRLWPPAVRGDLSPYLPLPKLIWSPNSGLRFRTSGPSDQAGGLDVGGGGRWALRAIFHSHRSPWAGYPGSSGDKNKVERARLGL